MRITDVTAYKLSSPIDPPDEREFFGGVRRILKRDIVLVKLEAAGGEKGYATAGASSSEMREYFQGVEQDDIVDVLESVVAPLLADTPLESIAEASKRILSKTDLPFHLRWQATSAVDVALHDIVGKRRGVPIHELLAPEANHGLEPHLYASSGMYQDPDGYAEQAVELQSQGFFGYKYRPGGGPDHDRRTLQRIREAVGNDMEIMVDAHTWWKLGDRSYDIDQVIDLISEFEKYDPYWVEEPVQSEAYDNYEKVAARTDVPLAGGESELSPSGLRSLGDTGAVRFLQADVRHHGGFTGCWNIVKYCANRDICFVPHNFGTHLGLVANAHLVAAAPDAELLEYPVFGNDLSAMYPFPLAEEILSTPLDVSAGRLQVPTDPGLGVEVNCDAIERYPPESGPWTEFTFQQGN